MTNHTIISVQMVFFPEDFHCLTTDKDTVDRAVSEDGPYLARFRNLARKHQIWLSLGGFYNKVSGIYYRVIKQR